MKIRLVMIGKTRRAECRALLEDYVARIARFAEVQVVELRDGSPASRKKLRLDSGPVVLLDAGGKQHSSEQFARWLGDLRDRGTRELTFLCGDAEGLPEELGRTARTRVSLSTLTMQHELARVVLAEQLYRALSILAGHSYHK